MRLEPKPYCPLRCHYTSTADDRGYLAAAASRFSLWWHGDRRPPALTADTASGAGLQGGIEDDVPPSNGGAATAPFEGGDSRTDSNLENIHSLCMQSLDALRRVQMCNRLV